MRTSPGIFFLILLTTLATLARAADVSASDYLIKEGHGLPHVYLDMQLEEAVRATGEPDQNLYGFVFMRKLADGTQLSYRIADDLLVSLNFKGDAQSKYATARAAKFGMARSKILQLYGPPEAEAVNKIFYYSQGISFFFKNDVLYEISVFPQKTSAQSGH